MRTLISLIFILFFATNFALAEIEVRNLGTLKLSAEPLQTVTTTDGQRIYVLTKGGGIQLFSGNGEPLGTFDAGPDVTSIAPQGNIGSFWK